MAKINKKLDIGGGIELKIAIDDGKAVMVSNYGREMLKIYYKAKEAGKKVSYDYRRNAMIELFDCSIEDYEKALNKDTITAFNEQKKVMDKTKEDLKNAKNTD